jgi:hypothetical protein
MTFATPLRDLARSPADFRAEAEAKRAQEIRDGRAWVETHMDMTHPWPIHDECAFTVTRMLNAGRDGIEVMRYVAACSRVSATESRAESNTEPQPPFRAWQ